MTPNNKNLSELFDTLFTVIHKLDTAEIKYMITGSVAGFIWGIQRFTQDIDIVISTDNITRDIICKIFPESEYYISETALDNIFSGKETIFNIIELENYNKIDLIALDRSEYSKVRFQNRKKVNFEKSEIWVISPEDLVLSKLNWLKSSGSEQQRNDITAIVDLIDLDTEYIGDWAKKLGTFEIWQDLSTHHKKHTR